MTLDEVNQIRRYFCLLCGRFGYKRTDQHKHNTKTKALTSRTPRTWLVRTKTSRHINWSIQMSRLTEIVSNIW